MTEASKPTLGELRKQYKQIVGKNPSPKLDVEGLAAKIAEIQAGGDVSAPKAPDAPAAPKAKKAKPAAEPTKSAPGTAYMRHPEGIGCSFGGVELAPEKDGKVLVPLAAVEDLQAHGFEIV